MPEPAFRTKQTLRRAGKTLTAAFLVIIGCLAPSVCGFLLAGCKKEASVGATVSTNAPLSPQLFEGIAAQYYPIQVAGQTTEATILPKNLGEAALFLCYYPLPKAAENKMACDAAVNAEIDRCVANAGAEVLSRKAFPSAAQPTAEVVAKSSKRKSHSIRCRVICTGKQIHSLTAVTPDNQDAIQAQAIDKMFEEFHAR